MKSDKRKRIGKILLCIIISLVIDFLFLYAELKYLAGLICCDTFFGLFTVTNDFIRGLLFSVIGLLAGLVVAIACKLLKLRGKGKIIFIIVHSVVIVGVLLVWYCIVWF